MTAGSNPSRWRPRLAETLGLIAAAAPAFTDEWWIIGSAAAALAGADIAEVRDVDLLLSERDATALWRAGLGRRRRRLTPATSSGRRSLRASSICRWRSRRSADLKCACAGDGAGLNR